VFSARIMDYKTYCKIYGIGKYPKQDILRLAGWLIYSKLVHLIPGAIGAIAPPKTYESNFFHYDFVRFGKKLDCQLKLTAKYYCNRPPKLMGWICTCLIIAYATGGE